VAQKTHYENLELPQSASAEDIKKSFRTLIARYHPDKVQHLGKEFQDMAADRAAELTEAYRILSDRGRREEYDRTLGGGHAGHAHPPAQSAEGPAQPPPPVDRSAPYEPPKPRAEYTPPPPPRPQETPEGKPATGSFKQERQVRDEYLRKATLSRFRTAVTAVGGYDETQIKGFEVAFVPKSKFLSKNKNPRLLGRFISKVDGAAVAETWNDAGKWTTEDVCVLLLGSSLAPARELATAIQELRKRKAGNVTLIPVDARDWQAHVPTDAPDVAKNLLTRLRGGT
jgi:curved DNA-binding protein CbpA